jgi:uncharacterized protein (DUF488 family)
MSITIYTIGHSTTSLNVFFDTLKQHQITLLIDVRSKPFSRRVPAYNQPALRDACKHERVGYKWCGEALGGFGEIEQELFLEAVNELIIKSVTHTLVIMCSEGDYKKCHRYQKITPELEKRGAIVSHIRIGKKQPKEQQQTTLF